MNFIGIFQRKNFHNYLQKSQGDKNKDKRFKSMKISQVREENKVKIVNANPFSCCVSINKHIILTSRGKVMP